MSDDELRALGYTGRCDHLGGPENCPKQPGMYCVSCDGPMSEITHSRVSAFLDDYEAKRQALVTFLETNGYLVGQMMGVGDKVCFIKVTAANQGQIGISRDLEPSSGVSEWYSYWTVSEAKNAWLDWSFKNFVGEPEGWIRHQPSNRRRDNGDPATETIRR